MDDGFTGRRRSALHTCLGKYLERTADPADLKQFNRQRPPQPAGNSKGRTQSS